MYWMSGFQTFLGHLPFPCVSPPTSPHSQPPNQPPQNTNLVQSSLTASHQPTRGQTQNTNLHVDAAGKAVLLHQALVLAQSQRIQRVSLCGGQQARRTVIWQLLRQGLQGACEVSAAALGGAQRVGLRRGQQAGSCLHQPTG